MIPRPLLFFAVFRDQFTVLCRSLRCLVHQFEVLCRPLRRFSPLRCLVGPLVSVLPTRQVISQQLPAHLRSVLLQHCQCCSLRNLRNCLRNAQLCFKCNTNCAVGQKFSLKRNANSAIGQKFSSKRNANCAKSKKKI